MGGRLSMGPHLSMGARRIMGASKRRTRVSSGPSSSAVLLCKGGYLALDAVGLVLLL